MKSKLSPLLYRTRQCFSRVFRHLSALKTKVLLRHAVVLAVFVVGGLLAFGVMSFFKPQLLRYSYARANCFFNPVLFPDAMLTDGTGYSVTLQRSVSVGHIAIYSGQACVEATEPPIAGTISTLELAPLGNRLLKKSIVLTPAELPAVSPLTDISQPLSLKLPFTFTLDQADQAFTYRLSANKLQTVCVRESTLLNCDLLTLGLEQSRSYDFSLTRYFKNMPQDEVFTRSLTIIDPLLVTGASITAGQIIYDVPESLTLTLNKPAASFTGLRLQIQGEDTDVAVTTVIEEHNLVITFTKPLPRQTDYRLTIDAVEATDKSYLPEAYSLSFHTSGGPQVLGASIGSYKVSLSGNITLSFDAPLDDKQKLADFIRLEAGGAKVPATITVSGKKVVINPAAALPRCSAIKIKVLDGLSNEYGVTGGSAWQYSSRSICQTVFSIGTSVQGRSLTAYRFGTGSSKIIFVGGMHGNEKSSVSTLNAFIDYLEANAASIPSHRTIIVIPNSNPDGYRSSSRTNAHNVDLNRNFPSNNWQTGVYMPGNIFLPAGGGSEPLSEPEANALASYVISQSPRLVLTYHATARVVIANDAGDSLALAQTYGTKSDYPVVSNSESDGTFDYDSTGEFEDWLHDAYSVPTLLIELRTMSTNEFNSQRAAMWSMVQLP